MPAFPVEVHPIVQMDGFSASEPDTLVQTEMEAGPPKVRRRFTAAYEPLQVSWVVNFAQLLVFRNWFRTELAGGAVPFDMWHPLEDRFVLAQFPKSGLPSYAPYGTHWKISATVWILP